MGFLSSMIKHVVDLQEALVFLPSPMCLCAGCMLSSFCSVTSLIYLLFKAWFCQLLFINLFRIREMLVCWYEGLTSVLERNWGSHYLKQWWIQQSIWLQLLFVGSFGLRSELWLGDPAQTCFTIFQSHGEIENTVKEHSYSGSACDFQIYFPGQAAWVRGRKSTGVTDWGLFIIWDLHKQHCAMEESPN